MNDNSGKMNSPWLSMVILLGLTIGCAIGVSILVSIFGLFFSGNVEAIVQGNIDGLLQVDFKNNAFYSYAMIIGSSFGTFLLPAWFLQKIEPYNNFFPHQKQGQTIFVVLTILFLVAFMPTMGIIAELNLKMSLPESMQAVESWMREQEDSMALLTKNLVMVDSWGLLIVNLFAVAVMPAIAEEYYFRGSLMNIVQRVAKNSHVTIWFTAIIFSAIHVQFFGFFPRLILGAFFGYMLLWTNNIWIPIVGHFVNNASAVVLAFYYTRQGKTYEDLQSSDAYPIFVYIASFFVSAAIGWYFYKKSNQINIINGKGLV